MYFYWTACGCIFVFLFVIVFLLSLVRHYAEYAKKNKFNQTLKRVLFIFIVGRVLEYIFFTVDKQINTDSFSKIWIHNINKNVELVEIALLGLTNHTQFIAVFSVYFYFYFRYTFFYYYFTVPSFFNTLNDYV